MANDRAVLRPWSSSQARASDSMTSASQPARPATPSMAAALPARPASSVASVLASSTSLRNSVLRSLVISESNSPSDASGRFGWVAGSKVG